MSQKKNITLIGIVLLAICFFAGLKLYDAFKPSTKVMDLYEYYGTNNEENVKKAVLVLQDFISDQKVLIEGQEKYLEYSVVNDKIDDKFYWDDTENILIYTTPTEIIKTGINSTDYTVNKETKSMTSPIVKTDGDIVYISLSYIKQFSNIEYEYFENPNRLVIKYKWNEDILMAQTNDDTEIRYKADKHSDILVSVKQKTSLILNTEETDITTGYTKVATEDGIVGYVLDKKLGKSEYKQFTNDYTAPAYSNINKGYVSLAWYSATNQTSNKNISTALKNTQGITVVSPTWLSVSGTDGSISSLASNDFVTEVHNKGMDVWMLINDFDPNVSVAEVLSHTTTRETLINNIIAEVVKYNAEGINIDFEYVTEESSKDYLQFIRELSIKCRANNLVLSVDSYVYMSYNSFYYRGKVSEVADYVVIMGYDEHHKNSEEAGSVASITWTKKAIENSIADGVSKDKLVIGMPFYSRLFEVQDGAITNCTSLSMEDQKKTVTSNNATTVWDEETQQNYVEYSSGNIIYKMWMEDSQSIEAKLKVINESKVGGIAFWRLGYETSDCWNTIIKYTNK